MNFFIVLKLKILSIVYTPRESAWMVLEGLKFQYGVNYNKFVKKDFSAKVNFPDVDPKRVKIGFAFMLLSLISICVVLSWSPLV